MPPPANKAIRDGKDADTAAFGRHSEQKRKAGRDREGIKMGVEGRRGGEVSVVVVNQKRKPTLCCQGRIGNREEVLKKERRGKKCV